jgi:hypothetical protein
MGSPCVSGDEEDRQQWDEDANDTYGDQNRTTYCQENRSAQRCAFQIPDHCIDAHYESRQERDVRGIVKGVSENSGMEKQKRGSQEAQLPVIEPALTQ